MKKVPKSYFQSQFFMSKMDGIFSKKKLSKNINLGDRFLVKSKFLGGMLILGQKLLLFRTHHL